MRAKSKLKTSPAPKPEEDRFEWDGSETGFGIRHRPGRKPAWYFQTRIEGKTVRRSLGPVEDLSRAEAIASANDLQDQLTGKVSLPVLVPNAPKAKIADFTERVIIQR